MLQLNDRTDFAVRQATELAKTITAIKARDLPPKILDGAFRKAMEACVPLVHGLGTNFLVQLCQAVVACPDAELRVNDTSIPGTDSFEVYSGDNLVGSFANSYVDIAPHSGTELRLGLTLTITPWAQLHLDRQSGCPEAIDTIEDLAAAS